jgi:hypothetical protein
LKIDFLTLTRLIGGGPGATRRHSDEHSGERPSKATAVSRSIEGLQFRFQAAIGLLLEDMHCQTAEVFRLTLVILSFGRPFGCGINDVAVSIGLDHLELMAACPLRNSS